MKSSVVLSGNLDYLNLGELIQFFGNNKSTGTLRIFSKYVETPGLVFFQNGNAIEAMAGKKSGVEALYDLFGWTKGDFEFVIEPVQAKRVINMPVMSIAMEGTSRLDDGKTKVLGPAGFDAGSGVGKDSLPVIRGPLIDYMDVVSEEEYPDGHPIVHEGKHGTWLWVILEGEIKICKETPGGLVPLLKVGAGSFIGSLSSFLNEKYVRSATAVASDRVVLGVLDRQRLTHEFSTLSPDFKNIVSSLDNRLRQLTFLASTGTPNTINKKTIAKGKTVIIKEGDKYDKLLSIRQGSAYVVKKLPQGDVLLCELGKDDFVGQIPFLNIGHEPESASVFGSDDLQMSELNIQSLEEEHSGLSGTMANMAANYANFIAATTGIALNIYKKEKK